MSLESLLKPAKWVDTKVQKQYTRLGKRIPEKHLYKTTFAIQMIGKIGTATWGPYIGIPHLAAGSFSGVVLDGPDCLYNVDGLEGKIDRNSEGGIIALNSMQNFSARYNRTIRLPVFLTGVGFLGKVIYDVANYVVSGEPLTSETAKNVTTGFGFLSLASSMYLKDQDPKLLEKQPSKLKAFLGGLYEKAKGLIPSPQPVPQPIPINRSFTLEDYAKS
ncbi:hypothetical protein HOA91_03890 [Candidatus Woesearchaeota archaeon]|jgi:hypothetical protein|nr:hypothetical protein [Candidatus Woesearchaeota archaeon]